MIRVVTPPAETPEILDSAKTFALLRAEKGEETAVQDLIRDVTRVAERIASRPLVYADYEELLEGTGQVRLFLQARPIDTTSGAVSTVQFSDDDPLIEGTDTVDFAVWPNFLYREDGWPSGLPGWKIIYKGAYYLPSMVAAKPTGAADVDVEGRHVRRAILEIVQLAWARDHSDRSLRSERTAGSLGMAREFVEDGFWIPESARKVLAGIARKVA